MLEAAKAIHLTLSSTNSPKHDGLSPVQRALRSFVRVHPGLKTSVLADAFGLPAELCAAHCEALRQADALRLDTSGGWRVRAEGDPCRGIASPAEVMPEHLLMLFEQSLDGLFFMMLDQPLRWDDSIDKERALDLVFESQRITEVNDAMCRQYAARPEQLLGLRPLDFFAHDLAHGRREWRRLFDTGRLHTETDERRFDGSLVSIEGDYRCLYDTQQRIIGHFGVQRDVTERRRAQRTIAENEARFRDILDSAADFIWEVDREGRFIYLSGKNGDLLGYERHELLGKTPFEFMDASEAERIRSAFEQARDQSLPLVPNENWLQAKDGQRRCFAFSGVPVLDESGVLTGYRGLNRDITEQKRADEALRLSEQRLRTLFEMSPESIVILDPETTLPIHFNRIAHERLGYSADEFAKLRIADYEIEESAEAIRTHVERIRSWGRDDFETRHRCRDGRVLNIIVSVQLTELNGRQVIYAMFRDVTELRALSERLLLATSVGGIGIWEWEVDGDTVFWDAQMYRLYGAPLGDGREPYARWLLALHPADRPRMEQLLLETLGSATEFVSEFRILRGDEIRWLRVAARILVDATGRPAKMIGCNWDITSTRQAQERMARSEAQFRGAFESAPNGMALVDAEGRWLEVNQALCDILGYSAEELLAVDFQSISHPDDLSADFAHLEQLISGRTDRVLIDKRYIHKDGHSIPVLVSASAVRDDAGALSFVVAHILDLTERRASEAAMLAAKEAAEAANRAKSEFLANMSHEIRTPLNAMIGLTELVLTTSLDDRQRDYLSKVRQSSRALLGILNDILDYSKIEAGQVELEQRTFKLENLLEQLTALFQAAAEAKGLDLFYRVAPDVPRQLIGDAMRLGQILNNLIGNAVKFTESGSVELAIGVREERDRLIELDFAVQDTGIGLEPSTIARLFQAFTQADGSITRSYGGTGLGLTISQRLTRLMGGTITVDSELGNGSTFRFNAWFRMPETDPGRIGALPRELERSRILIVDNRPAARRVLGDILESWHMPLFEATDCIEARQVIAKAAAAGNPIDLVLLEAKQCFDCTRCPVAAAPLPRPGLPPKRFGLPATPTILMVSTIEQAQLLARARQSELPILLPKPVTPSALFNAIAASIQKSASAAQRPTPAAAPSQRAPNLQGARILVAEDNRINQMVAEELLTRFGCQVTIANNGHEAVTLALEQTFDAVLMDLQMPAMDGLEATALIRERKRNSELPIIALTAAALETDKERCLAAGMNDHLGKPIVPTRLLETLHHWVKPPPSSDRREAPPSAEAAAAEVPATLERLRTLIRNNEYVPPELIAALGGQVAPGRRGVLTALQLALAAFDYDAAARALENLSTKSDAIE